LSCYWHENNAGLYYDKDTRMLRILNDWIQNDWIQNDWIQNDRTQNNGTQNDWTQNDRTQNDKDTDYDRIIAMIKL
jgi:hypothetical protein